jgi:hypothetical protein
MPALTRPHRPFLWSALALDIGATGRQRVFDRALYQAILASPVSITYFIRGIVMEVSATFVATTILSPEIGAKIFCWSDAAILPKRGMTAVFA